MPKDASVDQRRPFQEQVTYTILKKVLKNRVAFFDIKVEHCTYVKKAKEMDKSLIIKDLSI